MTSNAVEPVTQSAPVVHGDRLAILVIDDDLGMRETFNWALRAHGFQVMTTHNGTRAIALGQSHHFDLMLVDLRLPDISGIEVIRTLQNNGSMVPFVLVSAFLTESASAEARRLGAVGVWEKPLSVDDVVVNLRAVLSGIG